MALEDAGKEEDSTLSETVNVLLQEDKEPEGSSKDYIVRPRSRRRFSDSIAGASPFQRYHFREREACIASNADGFIQGLPDVCISRRLTCRDHLNLDRATTPRLANERACSLGVRDSA